MTTKNNYGTAYDKTKDAANHALLAALSIVRLAFDGSMDFSII
jgi:hypothetical protein